MANILLDGYNLGLEKGTGVATYARNLSYEVSALGHEVSVLYGTRSVAVDDDLLKEVAFFDGGMYRGRALELLSRIKQALRGPFSMKAQSVPVTGKVLTQSLAARLPHFDRIYNSSDLFKSAQSAFWIWRRFTDVALPTPPDLAHWSYPLPTRIPKRPNIYTLHDLVPLRLPYTTLDNKRRYLQLVRRIASQADHIVTVSENSKRDLMDLLGIPEARITNTYQSVQIPEKLRAKPEEQLVREVEGITGFDFKEYFLFWGSLEPKKNVGRMIEAYLASDVEAPLVIIGAQSWKADKEVALLNEGTRSESDRRDRLDPPNPVIAAMARRRGARKRVVRLDYVPFSLLVSLIRGAKAALFPSLYEGFGLPALEAMLLETPVLCSNTSSLPEVAGDAALMVDPYDTQALTAGIRKLDADSDLRGELVTRGVAQARKFSPQNYRERLRSVYARYV